MIHHNTLPRFVTIGVNKTLDLELANDDGSYVNVVSGTCTIFAGSRQITTGALTPGAPATFVLLGTLTAPEAGATNWLEIWNAVDADGNAYTGLRKQIVLTPQEILCPIDDSDLTDESPMLLRILPPNMKTYATQRAAAWRRIVRKLKRSGKIAPLVHDTDSLVDVCIHETLKMIWTEAATGIGDQRYATLANEYKESAKAAWEELLLRYDRNYSGHIDGSWNTGTGEETSGLPTLWTVPPMGAYRR